MNSKWIPTILIILVLLNLVLIGLLLFPRINEQAPQRKQHPVEKIATQLNFDDQQKSELSGLIHDHRFQADEILKQLDQHKRRLFNQLDLDSIRLEQITTNIGYLNGKLDRLTYRHMQDIYSLCNEDQKPKFQRMMRDLLRNMKGKKPPSGRRPPKKM